MFEHYTERARQVVVLAQEEARSVALRHDYIGTEHILLGLLREEEGLAARALESFGLTTERALAQVVRIVGPGEEVPGGRIPFTPRAKAVLESADSEANELGHSYIGTEHILLGLTRETEGIATRILLDFNASGEKIRDEVMRMLAGPTGRRRGSGNGTQRRPRRRGLGDSEQPGATASSAIDPGTRDRLPPVGPVVSVIGEARLRAEPDEAMILVTLSALAETPGPALGDVVSRSGSLVAALDELSIPSSDRSTSGVSVREEFDHARAGRRSLGHRASSTTAVRLTDLDVIGRLITLATAELDATIDGPRWQIAPDNPVRLAAARQAAAHGRRKAQAYAEGVGAELGELVGLTELGALSVARRASGGRAAAAAHDMPIEPGDQEVTARIEVTYTLT